jgi:hypothetical protein
MANDDYFFEQVSPTALAVSGYRELWQMKKRDI